jgi:antitoxin (DNA-binding transcriptional repressor) of toxin-antitoxin stability system
MKTMTVRDVRLKWPDAERALARVGKIVVTRDSKPVARLLPYETPGRPKRARFDGAEHLRWLQRLEARSVDRRAPPTRP